MATIENKEVISPQMGMGQGQMQYPYRNDTGMMPPLGQDQTMPRSAPMRNEMPPMTVQGPPPATDRAYIPGFLAANKGRNVIAEFVIGTFNFDKSGTIIEVGANYFVLRDLIVGTDVMCDLYSVKFVTLI